MSGGGVTGDTPGRRIPDGRWFDQEREAGDRRATLFEDAALLHEASASLGRLEARLLLTRESGLALIADTQRWQRAYERSRDELAAVEARVAGLEAVARLLEEAKVYVLGIAIRTDWDNWKTAEELLERIDAALSGLGQTSEK